MKRIKSDLELLDYSLEDLKKIIYKTTKILKCTKCRKEQTVENLSLSLDPFEIQHVRAARIKSGPHGIYYICMGCDSNISIQTTIDFNEDSKLNELENAIKKFRADIEKAIKHIVEFRKASNESKIKMNKIKIELENQILKNRNQISKISEQIKSYATTWTDEDTLTAFTNLIGLTEKDYKGDFFGDRVKKTHIPKVEELEKNINKLHLENTDLEYKSKNATIPMEGLNNEQWEASVFIHRYCHDDKSSSLDPRNKKDKERIEEYHLKKLIKEKNKRIKLLKKIFRTSKGCIYILENDDMPGLYKVGWTERSADERVKELSGTGLPTPYKVAYSKSTNLSAEIEKTIHKKLDYCRHRSNREFFKASFSEIKEVVDNTLEELK